MVMTTAQLATLKTNIQSRSNLWGGGVALLSDVDIAAFYNTTAVPALSIWRKVTVEELNAAIRWADMLTLSTPTILTYQSMIWAMTMDLTDSQVRTGVTNIFTAGSVSELAIFAMGVKPATYLEALFATGGTIKVSKIFFGYLLQPQDVTNALSA